LYLTTEDTEDTERRKEFNQKLSWYFFVHFVCFVVRELYEPFCGNSHPNSGHFFPRAKSLLILRVPGFDLAAGFLI